MRESIVDSVASIVKDLNKSGLVAELCDRHLFLLFRKAKVHRRQPFKNEIIGQDLICCIWFEIRDRLTGAKQRLFWLFWIGLLYKNCLFSIQLLFGVARQRLQQFACQSDRAQYSRCCRN